MPHEHQVKQKTPVQKQSDASSGASGADKSKLKQAGFAEGSALLTPPVQAKGCLLYTSDAADE